MPTAGDLVPGGTTALARRLADLEREVKELRATQRAASTVVGTGRFRVQKPDGTTIVGIGIWPDGDYGTELRRDDGTLALAVSGSGTDVDDMCRIFSRSGSIIMMDDAFADGYLGRPWVPIPMTPGVTFTNAAWATTHSGMWWRQHAVLDISVSVAAPAATTAEVRVMARLNGIDLVQIGTTVSATNQESFWQYRATATELDPSQHGSQVTLLVQTQRTSGAGTCTAYVHGMWGSNTYTAAEA